MYLLALILALQHECFNFRCLEMFNTDVEYNHFGRYLRCRNVWHFIIVSSNFKSFLLIFIQKRVNLLNSNQNTRGKFKTQKKIYD